MSWSEIGTWLGHSSIYWLNFWRLVVTYILTKLWFLLSATGFAPLLRAAIQLEAQDRVQLHAPSRSVQSTGQVYRPYDPDGLGRRLRKL